jgi:hypothetical protein
MFYPYVTSAIENPHVREIIDSYIKWDCLVCERPKLSFEIDRDKSQIFGCAVEILLELILKEKSKIEIRTTNYESNMHHYLSRSQLVNGKVSPEVYIHSRLTGPYNYVSGKLTAELYTDGDIVKLRDVVNEYEKAILHIKTHVNHLFGNQRRETTHAILSIAKYYSTLKPPMKNINPKHYFIDLDSLLNPLDSVIEAWTKQLANKSTTVLTQPHFSFLGISGYGDFIVDDILLEIKCSNGYLRKADLRQVALYYLLNKANHASKQYMDVRNVALYYPLFQKNIIMPTSKIFYTGKTKRVIAELGRIFTQRTKYGFY